MSVGIQNDLDSENIYVAFILQLHWHIANIFIFKYTILTDGIS